MPEATRLPETGTDLGHQVLLVERRPLAARRIERCLHAAAGTDTTVRIATALEDIPVVVHRGTTDVVLIGDGFRPHAVLEWVRGHARTLGVPVVLLTDGTSTARDMAILAGAADALALPVSEPVYLARVLRHARVRTQAPAPASGDMALRQSLKLEAIGRLAGGVAHDFGNLLTIMMDACERMIEHVPPGTRLANEADLIRASCERGAALTRQLLAFSRRRSIDARPVDLRSLVTSSGRLLSPLIGEHIFLVIEAAQDVWPVLVDPAQFEQVVMNLVLNARDAMPAGGPLTLRLRNARVEDTLRTEAAAGDYVLFEVVDSGIGMSAEVLARAFEPFFTTKDEHKGTGLGLATVHGIVRDFAGHLRIDSAPGRGTTVGVYLPRCTEAPIETPAAAQTATEDCGTETVLLTEDEAAIRDLVQTILERHGYTVIVANGAPDAVALADSWAGRIDLLVSDIVMPGGSGPELARRLRMRRPEMRVLYMSGYPAQEGSEDGASDGASFLPKPFTRRALLRTLREVLDRPPAGAPDGR